MDGRTDGWMDGWRERERERERARERGIAERGRSERDQIYYEALTVLICMAYIYTYNILIRIQNMARQI